MEIIETALNFSTEYPQLHSFNFTNFNGNDTTSNDENNFTYFRTEFDGINDTSLDVGGLGYGRSFSLPVQGSSGPDNFEFNGSTPIFLYSSPRLFSGAVDAADYDDEDYESVEITPQKLLTKSSSDLNPLVPNLNADDTLEETAPTEKSVHKTTKKRKTIKKKHKKKRTTNKKHKSKSTKNST